MKQRVLVFLALTLGIFVPVGSCWGQTLFTTQTPALTNVRDGVSVNYELGMSFTSVAAGQITAIRFWKGSSESGTHTGRIWSASGQLLTSVAFTGETASGWQQQALANPLSITANTTYVVSVNTGNAYYVATNNGLATQISSGNLRSVVGTNGRYGSTGQFPTKTWQSTNYFRDVVFVASGASYSMTGTVSPVPAGSGVTISVTGPSSATTTTNSSGVYTVTGLANGTYTITPSKAGATFTQSNRTVTISGANVTGQNFTIQTYSISGIVSGGGGATVSLTGAASATVTADAGGSYTFSGLLNGTYTVTPSKAGSTFGPANRSVTINSANAPNINFAAVYTISGTVTGGGGATMTLTGDASATITAGGTGSYTFVGLPNGIYAVTPSKAGLTFNPASQTVTISGGAATGINFAVVTYSISGTITGGSGTSVTLSGDASATVAADALGKYTFSGLLNGNYTVTPAKSGLTFNPASRLVTISGGDAPGIDFAALYSISGTVTGGDGATMTLSGDAGATVTAGGTGSYSFTGLANGNYVVTPSKAGLTFNPASQTVTISGGAATGINFAVVTYSISGTISGGGGATVTLSGTASATTTANGSGSYIFNGLGAGNYTVEPSNAGFAFTPANRNVTIGGASITGIDFSVQTFGCSPAMANDIVCENLKPGTPSSTWQISGAGDSSIQGFATDISVDRGQTVSFKIKTDASSYRLDIYRMGYYGGNGARLIATVSPSASLPQGQPACLTDAATKLYDCGNWGVSASWAVPSNATSGIYFARVVRTDTGGSSHIVFIVRNDSSQSDILYQTSDASWQAYNDYGGNSLYGTTSSTWDLANRAYKVSYNRPFNTRNVEAITWVFGAEYPMVRWLEANGYDVTYFTDMDSDRNGGLIQNHKVFMSSGHDEYWSAGQRTNVEAARDAGVNLTFFSGNEVYTKTRWENSIDGSGTPYRTLVCYKETLAGSKIDPTATWTGNWRDPRFSPPADGGRPENSLTGTLYKVNGPASDNNGLSIQVPAADGKMRFWRNTSMANLSAGSTATLPQGTLGYEWDVADDNGSLPAGLFYLSTSTHDLTTSYLLDYGQTHGSGTATHHLTMYRAPSGAVVFGAGTVQWSWGLDNNHDNNFGFPNPAPNTDMRQATVNLFADMGVQPASIQSGLLPATKSTDTNAPLSVLTSPAAGSALGLGIPVTITGTALDSGGGVIAGVEVSLDGGATWHPANGRASWTYSFTPAQTGSLTLKSRAVDDSGNLETPGPGVTVSAGGAFSISGTIAPTTNGSGATVTLSGAASATVTADGSGNYNFSGLSSGGYTVTPSKTGFAFGPANQGVNITSASVTGIDFTATVSTTITIDVTAFGDRTSAASTVVTSPAFSTVSGNELLLAMIGADVSTSSGTNNSVTGVSGGGLTWVLVRRTNVQRGTAEIWRAFATAPLSNVTVTANLAISAVSSMTVISFRGVNTSGINGSGAIGNTGSGNGSTGTPTASLVTLGNNSLVVGVGEDWNAAPSVTAGPNQTVIHQLSLAHLNTIWTQRQNATTPASGTTVTINDTAPTNHVYNLTICEILAGSGGTAPTTYTISGTITPTTGGANATVAMTGTATASTTTTSAGAYSFGGLANGSYTLTPSNVGYTFSPVNLPVTLNGANVSNANFTAAPQGTTFTISGTVTSTGSGAVMTLSGSSSTTVTASGTGAYSFTNLPAGTYTVTPSKSGVIFSPTSQSVTITTANQTTVNFTASTFTSNFTANGSQTFQTMDGTGVNINVNSWNGGELKPALDLLVDTNGSKVFRVIRDPMTWVSSESLISPLHNLDATTLQQVYEAPEMVEIWDTIGYLNQKGIGGNQIVLNFMGWTPTWLGGSGAFGSPSNITAGKEPALATMIASLVYYGRRVRNLDFTALAPLNEQDHDCKEGPCASTSQYVTILRNLVSELNVMGLTEIRIVPPDTAGSPTAYTSALMADSTVAPRVDHLTYHAYGASVTTGTAYAGKTYWVTETGASCSSCDTAGTPSQGEWAFARDTTHIVLDDIVSGFTSVLVYDAYDSFYFHHNSFGFWGLLAYNQTTGVYTARKRFYANAQVNAFISPGAVRIAQSNSITGLSQGQVAAFYNSTTGKVTIIGHNGGTSAITINGQLLNLPAVTSLAVYITNSSVNLQRGADVPVNGNTFSVTIPADSLFSLTN